MFAAGAPGTDGATPEDRAHARYLSRRVAEVAARLAPVTAGV